MAEDSKYSNNAHSTTVSTFPIYYLNLKNHGDLYRTTMISGTITGLSAGQHINIHASYDNDTPEDGSDGIGFGTGIDGSGTGTDSYNLNVAAMAGYWVEYSPDNTAPVFYSA